MPIKNIADEAIQNISNITWQVSPKEETVLDVKKNDVSTNIEPIVDNTLKVPVQQPQSTQFGWLNIWLWAAPLQPFQPIQQSFAPLKKDEFWFVQTLKEWPSWKENTKNQSIDLLESIKWFWKNIQFKKQIWNANKELFWSDKINWVIDNEISELINEYNKTLDINLKKKIEDLFYEKSSKKPEDESWSMFFSTVSSKDKAWYENMQRYIDKKWKPTIDQIIDYSKKIDDINKKNISLEEEATKRFEKNISSKIWEQNFKVIDSKKKETENKQVNIDDKVNSTTLKTIEPKIAINWNTIVWAQKLINQMDDYRDRELEVFWNRQFNTLMPKYVANSFWDKEAETRIQKSEEAIKSVSQALDNYKQLTLKYYWDWLSEKESMDKALSDLWWDMNSYIRLSLWAWWENKYIQKFWWTWFDDLNRLQNEAAIKVKWWAIDAIWQGLNYFWDYIIQPVESWIRTVSSLITPELSQADLWSTYWQIWVSPLVWLYNSLTDIAPEITAAYLSMSAVWWLWTASNVSRWVQWTTAVAKWINYTSRIASKINEAKNKVFLPITSRIFWLNTNSKVIRWLQWVANVTKEFLQWQVLQSSALSAMNQDYTELDAVFDTMFFPIDMYQWLSKFLDFRQVKNTLPKALLDKMIWKWTLPWWNISENDVKYLTKITDWITDFVADNIDNPDLQTAMKKSFVRQKTYNLLDTKWQITDDDWKIIKSLDDKVLNTRYSISDFVRNNAPVLVDKKWNVIWDLIKFEPKEISIPEWSKINIQEVKEGFSKTKKDSIIEEVWDEWVKELWDWNFTLTDIWKAKLWIKDRRVPIKQLTDIKVSRSDDAESFYRKLEDIWKWYEAKALKEANVYDQVNQIFSSILCP